MEGFLGAKEELEKEFGNVVRQEKETEPKDQRTTLSITS